MGRQSTPSRNKVYLGMKAEHAHYKLPHRRAYFVKVILLAIDLELAVS